MPELVPSPHPESKGMSADGAKYLQAVSIAQQTGKSVEEVLQFMGITAPVNTQTTTPGSGELPKELQGLKIPLPPTQEGEPPENKNTAPKELLDSFTKSLAPKVQDDGFVITEEVALEDASEQDLQKLAQQEEDEDQDWSGKIRVGSKVRITWHRDQGTKGRLQWVGKVGKVVTATSKDGVTIYVVEFTGRKVSMLKLDKKSGKLLKGHVVKPFQLIVDDSQVELA